MYNLSSLLLSRILPNRSFNHVDVGTLQWLVHVAVLLVVESQRSLEKKRRPQKKRGVLKAKRKKNPSDVDVVVVVDVAITVALITYLADVADVADAADAADAADVVDVADVADVGDVEDAADVADVVVTVDGVVMETGTAISDMVTGLVVVVVVVDGDMGTTEDVEDMEDVEDVEDFVMEGAEDVDMDVGDAVDVVVAVDVAVAESSDLSWLKTAKNNQSNPTTAPRQRKKPNLLQRPKRQANDGDYGGVVEDVAGWVTWVEDHGVVVGDLVIGTGVDVAPLEVGVAMAVTAVVEVMVVAVVVEVSEAVEVMVAVASEVIMALALLVLEVDPHPLEADPGHFSMKGAANLTWVPKALLITLMMKNCRRKRLRHCQ